MFFDTRLWQFTRGVRLRIAAAVAMGVLASLVGIGRLALLGWLLARVFAGDTFSELMVPFALVAVVMVLRGWLEHTRAMVAHRTAAMVQLELRKRLYARVAALGPSYFGLERTGAVMISMIDGVEQLETYFGEYLPQLLVSFITPIVVLVLLAFLDFPVSALMFAFAMFTLFAPAVFQRWDAKSSMRRSKAYRGFAAEFLDSVQGLATLKAFGQSTERGRLLAERAHEVFRSTMWVLATNSLTRGLTDTGIAVGSAAVLAFGAWRVVDGQMSLDVLLVVLMMGIEVFRPQRDLRALLHNGMMGRAAADDIFTVLNAHPKVEPPEAPVELDGPLAPVVEFDDVSFAYPGGRRAAHRRLSFRVEPGERVGFVGGERGGEVHHRAAAPSLLRPRRGRGSDRRARPANAPAGRRLPRRRGGEPGHLPLSRHRGGEPCGSAGPTPPARRSRPRRAPRTPTSSSRGCRRATTRSSASEASGSREGSASASRSPARCCAMPRS